MNIVRSQRIFTQALKLLLTEAQHRDLKERGEFLLVDPSPASDSQTAAQEHSIAEKTDVRQDSSNFEAVDFSNHEQCITNESVSASVNSQLQDVYEP